MKRDLFEALQSARAAKRPVALATDLDSGRQALVVDGAETAGDLQPSPELLSVIAEALQADRSGRLKTPNDSIFVQVFNPPLRLVVVGAVHLAQALVPIAQLAGYEVTIVDPRGAWATQERFPNVEMSRDWPDDALRALELDRRCAVVTLTHDPKLDDPALAVALRSPAFYVGALGSTRTHAKRIERLREEGVSEEEIARIHAPVGLPIGARAPSEIAIAIMGQITQVLRGAPVLVKQDAARESVA